MSTLILGNDTPRELVTKSDGSSEYKLLGFASTTSVDIPLGISLLEVINSVTLPNGIWDRHSDDSSPAYVSSDMSLLAELLSDYYNCPVRPFVIGDLA